MTTGRLDVDGGSIAYDVAGTGDPLILLHAGLLDRHQWDEEYVAFSTGHTVIRYDARGHGSSSTPAADYADHEDLGALVDALGLGPVDLVGLSLGARTAIDFAIACPTLVRSLVAVSPGVSGLDMADPFLDARLDAADAAIRSGDVDRGVELFLQALVDGPDRGPSDLDPVLRERLGTSIRATVRRHGHGTGRPREFDAGSRLEDVSVPFLVVVGELDTSGVLGVAAELVRRVPGARIVRIPAAGHIVNLEARTAFDAAVLAFLAAVRSDG